jgi:peptide chain release factor subunit 1
MRNFNFLAKVTDARAPGGVPFISLYLDTSPNETGKKDHQVFLKKQIKDHLAVLPELSLKRDSFEKDVEKIEAFVDGIDPSVRGVAVFACSAANDFFETFEFAIPFPENRFYEFDRPFLYPLARLIDQNPTFAVVAADTNSAHIFVSKRAEMFRRDDIQNVKTNRTEVGGWSQGRYQRHVENFHQQHAKEVIDELTKLVQAERIERVVIAGDEAVIVPLLKVEMSEELLGKVVATLPLNVNTPEHEIAEAARTAVTEQDARADMEKIEHLMDVNYADGVGVTGLDKALAALFNGQVQELYLSADPDDIAYNRSDVKLVLANYSPGMDEDLPQASEKEALIDELIKQAATSAERIRFIEDPVLLKTAGGVGAILRYQAKGVSSS